MRLRNLRRAEGRPAGLGAGQNQPRRCGSQRGRHDQQVFASHQQSRRQRGHQRRFCPIRVVCWNTLSAGLSHQASKLFKVKHTSGQRDTLAAIRDTINLVDETFEATAVQYRRLLACQVSAADVRRYVKLVLELPDEETKLSGRARNTLADVVQLCRFGEGNDGKTAWSAYNGVTQYITHEYGHNADSRLRANWYGKGRQMNDRAFNLALQLAS
jgi:hypothetical protein